MLSFGQVGFLNTIGMMPLAQMKLNQFVKCEFQTDSHLSTTDLNKGGKTGTIFLIDLALKQFSDLFTVDIYSRL